MVLAVCRVTVLSGNMNMAVHTLGVNTVIRSLNWAGAGGFRETRTRLLHFDNRIGQINIYRCGSIFILLQWLLHLVSQSSTYSVLVAATCDLLAPF